MSSWVVEGTSKNLLAKKFIRSIIYSAKNIKINLFYPENLKDFLVLEGKNKSVPLMRDGNNQRNQIQKKSLQSKFEINNVVPETESPQTFPIILPNLIHKSKKRF